MFDIAQTPAMPRDEKIKISGPAVKKLRLKHKLTGDQFAGKIGLGVDRIRQIEGKVEVSVGLRTIQGFADFMQLTVDKAIAELSPSTPKIEQSIGDPVRRGIPLINKAPAGTITDYQECNMADSGQGHWYISRDGIEDPHAFAVIIVGDSMVPTFNAGAVAVFSPMGQDGKTLHKLVPVPEGHVVFVRFGPDAPEEGCTVARWHRKGKKLELRKDNNKYKSLVVNPEHVARIAALVRYDPLPGMTKMMSANEVLQSKGEGDVQREGQIHPEDRQEHPNYEGGDS